MNRKLVYKLVVIASLFLIIFSSVGVSTAEAASNTFYEGQGISRSKCTLRTTYSPSQLKKMGDAYTLNAIKIQGVGIIAGLTPVIGSGLARGASAISAISGLRGHALSSKGSQGYSANEYYCVKVNWDGYSPRSYVKMYLVR